MNLPDSSSGTACALQWKTYGVSRSEKQLLLNFILEGLVSRGCSIMMASDPGQAPFYLVFETPAGERHAVLAYAFRANSRTTNGRPPDEHRFQIKYGGELRGVLDVVVDPTALVTTIFLGIDLEKNIFVAADSLMNTPSPMSRSVEFMRLQTFPDDVCLSCGRADAQRLIGNAVPSALAEALGVAMGHQFFRSNSVGGELKLVPRRRDNLPPPWPVADVPVQYRSLIADHSAHPGTGKGNRAAARSYNPDLLTSARVLPR